MSHSTIQSKQSRAWLTVAMSAPLAHFSGGSWTALVLLGIICLALTQFVPPANEEMKEGKILCLIQGAWIVVLLSQWMPMSAVYWPGVYNEWIVPGVLLALGAYSCRRRPGRVAGVLFWVLVLMYVPVLFAGVKDVKLQWLLPEDLNIHWWMVSILLLPALLRRNGKTKGEEGRWVLLFGTILWMITGGVLSPRIAGETQVPFRELSRSLTIGAASRFESLIAVAVTFGWFALASVLIHTGEDLLKSAGIKGHWGGWLISAAAFGMILLNVEISPKIAAAITGTLWILLPVCRKKKNNG